MTDQLTTIKQTSLTNSSLWGGDFTDTADYIIPRIQLAQASSNFVANGKCMPGDILEPHTGEVLAKKGAPLEVLFIKGNTSWTKSVKENGEWKYVGNYPILTIAPPGKWTLEVSDGNFEIQYKKQLNLYCLLVGKINQTPFLATMKGMSVGTARKIISHFMNCDQVGVSPASSVFNLFTEPKSFNDKTFFAYETIKARAATPEESLEAVKWRTILQSSNNVKVVEEPKETEENSDFPFSA